MEDADVIARIDELVAEEHALRESSVSGTGLDAQESDRLRELEERLDQCWDLLRQRRARRSAGQDPDVATPRDTSVVEHYQQ
jgi:hypothetical protein